MTFRTGTLKAFDSVNHEIFFNTLFHSGISLNWFEIFLSDRVQCTNVLGTISSAFPITCGVPQGSVLGPDLILLYTNSLCDGNFDWSLKSFADDAALSYTIVDLGTLNEQMQEDKLKIWFVDNRMLIDTQTLFINFSLRRKRMTHWMFILHIIIVCQRKWGIVLIIVK